VNDPDARRSGGTSRLRVGLPGAGRVARRFHLPISALERVVRDRDLAERMGASARVRALAEPTIDRHVDRLVSAYAESATVH